MKKPGILIGAFIGLLLTAPLIAVFYLGWKLFSLAFAPFNVFDWLSRVLPGSLITYSIDTMVSVIRSLNLGGTSETAKLAEQTMAIVFFIIAGIVVGALFFLIMRFLEKSAIIFGVILGAVFGIIGAFINSRLTSVSSPFLDGIWILAVFLLWGAALGWSYRKLSARKSAEENADSVEQVDRRKFLVYLGGAAAAITVVGAVVGSFAGKSGGEEQAATEGGKWSDNNALPNADATVQPAPGTRPEFTPLAEHYRIDINTVPPTVDGDSWRLKVGGLVEQSVEMTLEQIRNYEPMNQFITLACISNPVVGDLIGTQRWTGVSLQKILPDFRLKPNATHLKISSADGFYEIVPLETIMTDERVMLTYAWDGVPLLTKHGFPLRIYIPNLYGMKQPKWIQQIEAIDHWEAGYWVERGWDGQAQMKATSVIDTVAVNQKMTQNGQNLIPVGGIAHAGDRGISKVELKIDDGEWQKAELRKPISEKTWVIWRYNWAFSPGEHTFTVRCTDGDGAIQIVEEAPPHPSGASGLHSTTATV